MLLDWVPAHFPTDAHGLARFDGTPLYEHADPREGYQRDWNTFIYNLGRNEVRGFLIASALHWLERFHADGLRVDAVAAMLYRDYSRKEGEWIPNIYGGRENLESIAFLQELRRTIDERCPGAILVAEESTAWPGVTRSPDEGGLGFHYKWNMGWMHDTLDYVEHDPIHRRYHHDEMTFGMLYAFSERFILPLSHDEVVYGKRSLLGTHAGRPLAALRQSARLSRLHVDASRQEAPVHGRRVRPGARMEPRRAAGLVPARRSGASRRAAAGARSQPALHRRAGALRTRLRG